MAAVAAVLGMLVTSASSHAADSNCFFLPLEGSGSSSSIFVDPHSKECRAFERELNASCLDPSARVELRPRLSDSGVTEPQWTSISLFEPAGDENAEAFSLLEKLVWSRAITNNFIDKELRATREVQLILEGVRTAQSTGKNPRFERTTLDLEGRDRMDVLYRLFYGLSPEAKIEGFFWKLEPNLFLERAVELAPKVLVRQISSHAAGHDVSGMRADVLMFEETPYLLTWTGGKSVLVYASYLRKNMPKIPQEISDQHTYVIPKLRCMFEAHGSK